MSLMVYSIVKIELYEQCLNLDEFNNFETHSINLLEISVIFNYDSVLKLNHLFGCYVQLRYSQELNFELLSSIMCINILCLALRQT